MKKGFFNFLKRSRHTKRNFIFDLDRTLWDFTVETSPNIKLREITNYVHRDRSLILKTIKEEGHTINIASRSKEPNKCLNMLEAAFPNIHFTNKQIFYTDNYDKQPHIHNIMQQSHLPDIHSYTDWDFFFLFDDEKYIIDDIGSKYKLNRCFHTPNGLHYGTFKDYL